MPFDCVISNQIFAKGGRRVKKLYKKFLSLSKKEKITEQKLYANLITYSLSIIICIAMLCGTTYAYFTSTASSSLETIQSAYYTVQITVQPTDNLHAEDDSHSFIVNVDGSYEFELKAGTASTGYFEIVVKSGENNSQCFKTTQVNKGDSVYILFHAKAGETISFSATWGTEGVGNKDDGICNTTKESPYIIGQPHTQEVLEEEEITEEFLIEDNLQEEESGEESLEEELLEESGEELVEEESSEDLVDDNLQEEEIEEETVEEDLQEEPREESIEEPIDDNLQEVPIDNSLGM